ncbi:MAG: 2OG-Fe(II) oxygenase [Alphaproteobacteria bacterium]|nr:2OG-Fe(II) oxygenase [Alphaproteobacteria bacterium]
MSYLSTNAEPPFVFDFDEMKEKGLERAAAYASADPFPHVVIDDFLPGAVAEMCLNRFPAAPDPDSFSFDRDQERFKTSYHPDYLHPEVRALFYAFNSRPFIRFVENITGIRGLIADHYFLGGGFHEIRTGGHLSVHADFNHHKPLGLERRVNLLIYLNKDWSADHGGQLELWRPDMSARAQSIVPGFNRCAIFTTTGESMHGNPEPVAHPAGVSRKSIALYYYTATWDETKTGRTTQFRARPESEDKVDWLVRNNEFINDFVPPALARSIFRIKRKLDSRR